MERFVRTQQRMIWSNKLVIPGIYALDCEMCDSIKGMELCKITVVDMKGRCIYDSFVKPEYYVIDFNTRFSRMTQGDVTQFGRTFNQVQQDLLALIHEDTIIVEHSLIMHRQLIDISLVFANEHGYPFSYSLNNWRGVVWKKIFSHPMRDKIRLKYFAWSCSCVPLNKI
ncbi:hypothetical protein WA026_023589 [Henosepilachna vigintioctopunctata]|uniref:Exonuclease domain-containing protein n=1 Tax=Henosepilachna vigintioctopunctata TaxID=420089 RepID=A0AAW1V639_9CUCU